MMRQFIQIMAFGVGFLAASIVMSQATGDPAVGKKLAAQCRTCHGIDGDARIPIAPTIAGEQEAYLARQLEAFRSGRRAHEMMSVVTKSLSDQDIADLAAWYANISITAGTPPAPIEAVETCIACHGDNGIATEADVPNLAGETVMYLDTQLKAFRTGKRPSEIMGDIAAELSNAEIRAVADWFSKIKLSVEIPK